MIRQLSSASWEFAALGVFLMTLALPMTAQANDESAVRGPYTFLLEGVITFNDGASVGLPAWAVGRFVSDGRGNLSEIDSTLNVGGCALLKQSGNGTYTVNPNGTGSAATTLHTDSVEPLSSTDCPALDQSLLADDVRFSFSFAITRQGLDFIGLDWKDDQGDPIVAFGSRGSAQRQSSRF